MYYFSIQMLSASIISNNKNVLEPYSSFETGPNWSCLTPKTEKEKILSNLLSITAHSMTTKNVFLTFFTSVKLLTKHTSGAKNWKIMTKNILKHENIANWTAQSKVHFFKFQNYYWNYIALWYGQHLERRFNLIVITKSSELENFPFLLINLNFLLVQHNTI